MGGVMFGQDVRLSGSVRSRRRCNRLGPLGTPGGSRCRIHRLRSDLSACATLVGHAVQDHRIDNHQSRAADGGD